MILNSFLVYLSSLQQMFRNQFHWMIIQIEQINPRTMQLKDPTKNRKVNTVPIPYQKSLSREQLFNKDGVDWKTLMKFYKRQGKLSKSVYEELIKKAIQIIKAEPNLIKIQDPVTIVGDIHGQFYDLVKIIDPQTGGPLQSTQYLFLGDYVDRGTFSIEVLGLILALKITYPNTVNLLRGNHECRQLTAFFNFKQQCLLKYDQSIYDQIMDLFDTFPLAALVNNKFLCIHGGISPDIKNIEDIKKIDRFKEIPKNGTFCDLMWADPIDNDTGKMESIVKKNDTRGCSYYFGYELSKGFLQKNGLLSVIRAHEAQANGFKMYHWGGTKQFPTVITIFSAPNYCDFYNNKGAVIKFKNNTLDIQQFLQTQHPYLLPNFMDLFEWSIPFVAQKVTQMLYHLVKPDREYNQQQPIPELVQKKQLIEKLLANQKNITIENIDLVSLGGRTLDKNLVNELGARELTQKKYKKQFDRKKQVDSRNEKYPQPKH